MADLSFAYDAGMQDGKGDNLYMDFTHKYMFAVGVCRLPLFSIPFIADAETRLLQPSGLSVSSFHFFLKPQTCGTSVSAAKPS
jgi:hypothetical protein